MSRPAFAVLLMLITAAAVAEGADPAPPKTREDDVREKLHGVEVADPFRWLEDQDSRETRAWIDAQIKHARAVLDACPGRDRLARRLGELLKIDSVGMPVAAGGRYFFSKRAADQDLSVIAMREGPDGRDVVLIDPHPLSPDKSVSVSLLDVSRDGRLLAYGVRTGGQDEVTVRFFDVDARKDLDDSLPAGRYSGIAITPDRAGVFYSRFEPGVGPRVRYHPLPPSRLLDVEIFGANLGPDKIAGAGLTDDGRRLIVTVYHGAGGRRSDVYVADVSDRIALIERRTRVSAVVDDVDAYFSPEIAGDTLLLRTDWKAPRGRVLAVDLRNPAKANWKEIIPESAATLRGVSAVGGKLFAAYLDNVATRIKVFQPDGRFVRDLSLPGLGSSGGVSGRWDSPEAFFSFTGFTTPTTIFRYSVPADARSVWSSYKAPVEADAFETTQVFVESKDKTRIPMFLVHRKGLKLDGNNPTLLTGYGGFNIACTPEFSALATVWVELGGVYALANLRGGGEFGEDWHRAGMLDKKQNVFDDFLAAAEWLIARKYTRPARLGIAGRSNGGLLVGAALTQRPELFEAVVCGYPLLDMVRYHKFLVGRFWIPEYGSADDAKQFAYLRAYSPYHNVRAGTKYPAVMFVTGDADTRVAPLHARKMAALLQRDSASGRPVILDYDTQGGHARGKPVGKAIDDLVDELAFLRHRLTMPTEPQAPAGPPPTARKPVVEKLHGVEITDDYRWLEDQKSPETRAWIDAQTRYARAILDKVPGRDRLVARLTALKKIETCGIPWEAGGKYFVMRRPLGAELSILFVRNGIDAPDEVLVDPARLSPAGDVSVSLHAVSRDGRLLVYGLKKGGEDETLLRVMDVATRKVVDDKLPKAVYSGVCLKHDRSGFFYSKRTDAGSRIFYHPLGGEPTADREVFGRGVPADKWVGVSMSDDGRRLLYGIHTGWARAALYVQDSDLKGPVTTVVEDVAAKFEGQIVGDHLYLSTDWNAPKGRILRVDLRRPDRDHWQEIVPATDAPIEGYSLVGGRLFVNYTRDVASEIRVFGPVGEPAGAAGFGTDPVSVGGPYGRWDSREAFFHVTGFTAPGAIVRYDVSTGEGRVWFRPKVPFDSERFVARQVKFRSKDGTVVPMFLVHAKGWKPDGGTPTLLYGYGGFNASLTPYFSAFTAAWVEAGGLYAVANLRGGGEFGEDWHQAGMLDRKQNVFDDFLAAADWLIANKYTRPDRLAIMGGSNGGLLVGAALTQRPELFGAVVCQVPLLDMLRYHKLLMGPLWVPEYGSADDPEQFSYLHAYSPYHRVKAGARFPAVMFVTGDSDTRVDPMHARKMTALLQAATGSGRPVILLYDTTSGHTGEKPVAKQVADLADELLFLFGQLGMAK
jgi:prolyl oligopeptidase